LEPSLSRSTNDAPPVFLAKDVIAANLQTRARFNTTVSFTGSLLSPNAGGGAAPGHGAHTRCMNMKHARFEGNVVK
jgi:hypothetical protein